MANDEKRRGETAVPKLITRHSSLVTAVGGDLALALGVIVLGVALGVAARGIRFGVGYDRIGPRFFPFLVSLGLVVLGSWLAVAPIRGKRPYGEKPSGEKPSGEKPPRVTEPPSEAALPRKARGRGLAYLSLALALNLLLLERAGFVLASAALFWMAARAFGSRRPARDAVVAALLSALVYSAFTRGLGLPLPAGILERLF